MQIQLQIQLQIQVRIKIYEYKAFSYPFEAYVMPLSIVRVGGLEPPHLAALGPKPSASANSATPALNYPTQAQNKR